MIRTYYIDTKAYAVSSIVEHCYASRLCTAQDKMTGAVTFQSLKWLDRPVTSVEDMALASQGEVTLQVTSCVDHLCIQPASLHFYSAVTIRHVCLYKTIMSCRKMLAVKRANQAGPQPAAYGTGICCCIYPILNNLTCIIYVI